MHNALKSLALAVSAVVLLAAVIAAGVPSLALSLIAWEFGCHG
ncbi:hypothetical protein [Pseudomonas citronellolis]|nr:hypothetical protein [Pseudomonas citronellolis]UXJ54853.1 hypothetical protein N5P21_11840 [Pseudomonas citronellolis]